MADLGLFEKSFGGKTSWQDQEKVRIPCHRYPADDLENDPSELLAGGRSYLDTGDPTDPNRAGLIRAIRLLDRGSHAREVRIGGLELAHILDGVI